LSGRRRRFFAKQSNEGRCREQRPFSFEEAMTLMEMRIESIRLAVAIMGEGTDPAAILNTAATILAFILGDHKEL
jgi:hypothetical protein